MFSALAAEEEESTFDSDYDFNYAYVDVTNSYNDPANRVLIETIDLEDFIKGAAYAFLSEEIKDLKANQKAEETYADMQDEEINEVREELWIRCEAYRKTAEKWEKSRQRRETFPRKRENRNCSNCQSKWCRLSYRNSSIHGILLWLLSF